MTIEGAAGVGVSEDLTAELIDAAIAHVLPFAFHSSLAEAVRSALAARIPRLELLPAHSATVAIVGPGGSGKTSCCAMLLGAYRRAGIMPARCATVTLTGDRDEPALLLSPRIMQPLSIASPDAGQALTQAREEGLLLLDMPPLSPAERPTIERSRMPAAGAEARSRGGGAAGHARHEGRGAAAQRPCAVRQRARWRSRTPMRPTSSASACRRPATSAWRPNICWIAAVSVGA